MSTGDNRQNAFMTYLDLFKGYFVVNLKGEMEFRASFISQLIFMMLNNVFAMFFWVVFFSRFHEVKGWGAQEVILLWAVSAASFGLVNSTFGNAMRLHTLIKDGQLDYYLTMPKNTLFQILISRMSPSAWGDLFFGIIIGSTVIRGVGGFAVYAVSLALSATVLLAFFIALGSVTFWTGSADGIFSAAFNSIISFSLYPESLFTGVVRVLLYTAIPAGFIAYIPVSLLQHFRWQELGILVCAAAFALGGSIWLFNKGLRRYESGNLILMRQ